MIRTTPVLKNFFSHVETETFYRYDVHTIEELEQRMIEYITHYNENRRQKRLDKLSPVEYRSQH